MDKKVLVVGMFGLVLSGCAAPGYHEQSGIQVNQLAMISDQLIELRSSMDKIAEQKTPPQSEPSLTCLLADRVYTSGAVVDKKRCAIVDNDPVRTAWVEEDSIFSYGD